MAPSPQSAGQDLAVTGLAMRTSVKMEVMTPEADGEAGETSASTEAGCSDTLDLPRLIRVQLLWAHTTPAILAIRGREAGAAEFQKHWHMVYFVLAQVTNVTNIKGLTSFMPRRKLKR